MVVAAVRDTRNHVTAMLAAGPGGHVLCVDDIIARLLVQTARQPGLSLIYQELLGFRTLVALLHLRAIGDAAHRELPKKRPTPRRSGALCWPCGAGPAGGPHGPAREPVSRRGQGPAHAAGGRALAALNHGCAGCAYANNGRAAEGLLMARSTLAGCEGSAILLELTVLLDKVAWTAAMAGDAREAQLAVARSNASHDQVHDDAEQPDWLHSCSRDESSVMAGRVLTETHGPLRAVPLLTAALERYDITHIWEVALYSPWLAQAYVDANEIDEAAQVASRVYDLAAASDSPRAVRRLDTVLETLTPHRDTLAVRDFLERAASRRGQRRRSLSTRVAGRPSPGPPWWCQPP
ncbi:hypothetical protein [Streptomyces sp. H27-C3]|uniref:CASTOR/POLLUX-related putative ion channel n=1 Tax=Streptomyces sp. H27-C3 TaxID=3046305 RepID=UPI0024BB36D9|nr:hypothetical protein [Streptomyces sp. H27-C3]MDJ0465502.1 hypothetical protein [Streptomyces sp. H27-C3]